MAEPITSIQLKKQTVEEIQAEQIEELQKTIAEQQQALQQLVAITGNLHEAGMLDAVEAAIKAKDELANIAVKQASSQPILNLIKHVMNASEALSSIDAEKSAKLVDGLKSGLNEAELADGNAQSIGIFDLIGALKDPDVNRSVKYGLNFLKGLGKGLDEEK